MSAHPRVTAETRKVKWNYCWDMIVGEQQNEEYQGTSDMKMEVERVGLFREREVQIQTKEDKQTIRISEKVHKRSHY